MFNPIYSTILKRLKFKFVSWRRDIYPCTAMVLDCLIDGLLSLHHIQSLANIIFFISVFLINIILNI
jgi:phage-related holin